MASDAVVNFVRKNPLAHIRLATEPLYPFVDEKDYNLNHIHTVTAQMVAKVADTRDRAIVEAVIQAAEEAGVRDLYILSRSFVFNALREKMEREGLWNEPDRLF